MKRINKYLAEKKIASRREADTLIKSGKVFINGKVAALGTQVSEKDTIEVKGHKKDYHYYAFYKPVGIVTTNPSRGEKEIVKAVKFPVKVFPVGRLDKDSEGLIILTNDGRITDKLLNPKFLHEKEYEVAVDKPLTEVFLQKMRRGVNIGDYFTKPAKVKQLGSKKFSIILTEGKNRQIRRMCEALSYQVLKLKRVRIMNIHLANLKPSEFHELSTKERQLLLAKSL